MEDREKIKEDLFFVTKSFYLWGEMDYNISIIGASMPFRMISELKTLTKEISEKENLNIKTLSKIENILKEMEGESHKGILSPDLEKMKKYSDRLMRKYLILNLISKEEYVALYDKIYKIKDEARNLPEDVQNKLNILRAKYIGKGHELN